MKNRTLVHNLLPRSRTLNWTAAQRMINANGWIMLDGAYPDSCVDDSSKNQFSREVAACTTKAWIVTELPALTFENATKMMEEARKNATAVKDLSVKEIDPRQYNLINQKRPEVPVEEVKPIAKVIETAGLAPEKPVEPVAAPKNVAEKPVKQELMMAVEAAPVAGAEVDRDQNAGLVGMFTSVVSDNKDAVPFGTPVTELLSRPPEVSMFPQGLKSGVNMRPADRQNIMNPVPTPEETAQSKQDHGAVNLFAGANKARQKRGQTK